MVSREPTVDEIGMYEEIIKLEIVKIGFPGAATPVSGATITVVFPSPTTSDKYFSTDVAPYSSRIVAERVTV
jgi:hypothetical protein